MRCSTCSGSSSSWPRSTSGGIQLLGIQWLSKTDPKSGATLYVNQASGHPLLGSKQATKERTWEKPSAMQQATASSEGWISKTDTKSVASYSDAQLQAKHPKRQTTRRLSRWSVLRWRPRATGHKGRHLQPVECAAQQGRPPGGDGGARRRQRHLRCRGSVSSPLLPPWFYVSLRSLAVLACGSGRERCTVVDLQGLLVAPMVLPAGPCSSCLSVAVVAVFDRPEGSSNNNKQHQLSKQPLYIVILQRAHSSK